MAEEPATTTNDPQSIAMKIGELKAITGISVEDSANFEQVLDAVIEWAKGKTGTSEGEGGEEGGGEGGETETAASKATLATIAKAAGLKVANPTVDLVVAKVSTLRQGTDSVGALKTEVDTLSNKIAERDLADKLRPYIECGALDPADRPYYTAVVNAAKRDWNEAKVILDQKKAMLPPQGRTTPPKDGAAKGTSDEEVLINKALADHEGNHKNAMIALQTDLKKPYLDQGYTHKAANEMCANRYPKIFGAAV